MAIYDVDAINEQELAASREDILDNMLEACDQMLSAIGESDRVLKNERNRYQSHGPEDYSKWSNEDLKSEFEMRKGMAARDKAGRDEEYRYTHIPGRDASTQGAHNRRKADAIGKELAKRGEAPSKEAKKKAIKETCLSILSVIDEL